MKKISALLMIICLCLFTVACGKSSAAKEADVAIEAIGEVTLESEEAITTAEKLYGILTENEKSTVENRLALTEARDKFDKLVMEKEAEEAEAQAKAIYDNAKDAFDKLNSVADICISGMDDVYNAWHYGIYDADDAYGSTIFYELSQKTSFSSAELEEAANVMGIKTSTMNKDWQYVLYVVEAALALRGDYDNIEAEMNEAQTILQELTNKYDDYTYYPKLKEYYAAVSSYADFFMNPSGSFQQLLDTVNNYETNIRTYQSDVGFLFK